ncbi:MAG: VOC family protein [Balneolaceae bacterium]|nr:VOC family protein [Balneolaceae bacterium]
MSHEGRNPVNWFELPAADITRAKKFYEHVLGIEIALQDFGGLQMGWFPSKDHAQGASGSLVQNDNYIPSHEGSMVYFSVDDIEKTLADIEKQGGKIINSKTSIGEFGFVGHFEDSEGNRVGLHSSK